MREILFRGKRVDNGDWVEGWFCGGTCIHPFAKTVKSSQIIDKDLFWHEVIPETVGQYTGLTDKNGKKIFEGDIIKHYIKNSEFVKTYVVAWENRLSKFVGKYICDEYYGKKYAYAELHENLIYEVIGNIHDNPELLGGA